MRIEYIFLTLFSVIVISCSGTSDEPSYSYEDIQQLSQSDDYDGMLDALSTCVDECATVKDKYLDGNLKDKEAQSRIEQIEHRYEPLINALSEAESKGELTYDQHQRQMELTKQAMGEALDGIGRALDDAGVDIDDLEDSY